MVFQKIKFPVSLKTIIKVKIHPVRNNALILFYAAVMNSRLISDGSNDIFNNSGSL